MPARTRTRTRMHTHIRTPTHTLTQTHTQSHTHTYTQRSIYYSVLFHNNNGFVNAPHCYVLRTLHVLFYLSFFEYKFHIMEGLSGYLIAYVDNFSIKIYP